MNKIFALSAISLALTGCGTDPTSVDNAPGTITLSGNAIAGETLTATVSDPDGVSGSISYQWLVNNTPLTSATASTFTLTADQRGAVMRVSATYIDDNGTRESMTSNQTGAVLANVAGVVTISGSEIVGETLTAGLADDNGVSSAVVYSWAADGVAIDGATEATFVLTTAQEGAVITATATYTDDEGFAETAVSAATGAIAPVGTNTPATFDGLTATVTNAATAAITGTIAVNDIDDGEASLVAQTDTDTTYGTFSVTQAGAFTYTLNVADATVAALMGASDTIADQVTVTSFDGTTATFDITITGVNAPAAGNQAAIIRDLTDNDTGELRFSLPEALAQGRLEVTFTRTDDAVGSTDAFITLYNSGNNNAGNILDLRVKDDSYAVRSPSSIDVSAASVVPGELSTVVATWEYPNGNTATGSFPVINLTIDGVVIPEYTVADSTPEGGVTTVSFRLGSNSN
ncbi:MAG: VCBS domain-containing protein, partial [Glaciecola sp.]